jgi:hypothetical protein
VAISVSFLVEALVHCVELRDAFLACDGTGLFEAQLFSVILKDSLVVSVTIFLMFDFSPGIFTKNGAWVNLNSIDKADRNLEVQCMCWGNEDQTEVSIYICAF